MTEEKKAPERASLNTVVMKRALLLEKLVQNKAKHDAVLDAAIEGYWQIAKDKLAKKEKTCYEQLADFQSSMKTTFKDARRKIKQKHTLPSSLHLPNISVDSYLGLEYPQDHSQDYDRAIEMMRASIFDEVVLSPQEFDRYVMNQWEWRNNFVSNSLHYANSVTGCWSTGMHVASSGLSISPENLLTYNTSRVATYGALISGGLNF